MSDPQEPPAGATKADPTAVASLGQPAISLTPDAMAGLNKTMRTSSASNIVNQNDQTRDASLQFRGCIAQDSCLTIPPETNGLNLTAPLLKGEGKFNPAKFKASMNWRF